MKKIYIVIILFVVSFAMNAQDYKLFGASANNKMQLKWMSKNLKNNTSFDLLRKEGNGPWEKINTTPIIPSEVISEAELKTAKNKFPKDKSYEFYIKCKNSKETVANKKAYENYQLALAAIFDNQVAKHLGIFFEDASAIVGKTYSYKLVDGSSKKELSVVNGLIVGDIPAAPENVKAEQIKQNIKLTWKNNEDFMGYNLYRNGTKINKEPVMANLGKTVYQAAYADADVAEGSYTYILKGITFLNTESKASAEVKIEVKDITPPVTVKGLKAERKNEEVILSWKASTDKEVAGYNVFKSEDKGKTFHKINEQPLITSAVTYVEKLNPTSSGTFQYQIESVDKNQNGIKTIPVSVFVPDHGAPSQPKDLIGRTEAGKITLNWKANGEKDLAGYRIYRGLKDDDENEMLLLNVTPQTATTFVDTFNEKAGTKFIYKVAAIDKSFNESEKAVAWLQLPDVIAPSAPFLKEANYERNQVNLKWDPILNDAILGYEVYRVIDGNESKVNAELIKESQFSDKTLREKGIYEYYVKAVDSAKLISKASNKLVVTTANSENQKIQLTVSQDIRARKVQLKIEGIEPVAVQEAKLFRKSGDSGFLRIPFRVSEAFFTDETSEEGVIYEYYVEVITTDEVKLRTEKVSINNAF